MDSTPLHPDVHAVDPSLLRHGSYLTAIPHTRRLFRFKLAVRVVSVVCCIVLFVMVAALDGYIPGMLYAGVPAGVALSWDFGDLVYLAVQFWRARRRGRVMMKDAWGPPGLHVAVHLIVWVVALAMMTLQMMDFRGAWEAAIGSLGYYVTAKGLKLTNVVFLFLLMLAHFILFVFACLETDFKNRDESDVVFLPNESLQRRAAIPPSSLLDIFSRKKAPLAYYANHYVRYVPGTDGTLQVARDYTSRHVRV